MSDTISRQAAIDAVKKNTFRLTFAEEQNCEGHVAWSAEAVYSDVMEGALLDLPSAQPEQRWIPCSERLPEANERCLCTYEFNEGTCVDFGLYTKRGWFVSGVTAWMPLPEPWRGEEKWTR